MKLIRDWFNGGRWQWRYYNPLYDLWFDFGPSFAGHNEAMEYMYD